MPELGHLIGGQRHDYAVRFFEPKPSGHPAAWTAVAERRLREIGVLEAMRSRSQRTSGMKPIQRTKHTQAMVDGLGSRLRIFIELITDIIEQGGFIHFLHGAGGTTRKPPACE